MYEQYLITVQVQWSRDDDVFSQSFFETACPKRQSPQRTRTTKTCPALPQTRARTPSLALCSYGCSQVYHCPLGVLAAARASMRASLAGQIHWVKKNRNVISSSAAAYSRLGEMIPTPAASHLRNTPNTTSHPITFPGAGGSTVSALARTRYSVRQ